MHASIQIAHSYVLRACMRDPYTLLLACTGVYYVLNARALQINIRSSKVLFAKAFTRKTVDIAGYSFCLN